MPKQIPIAKSLILAGYIRVSSVGQEDGTSLQLQAKQLEKWCADNGHVLRVIYFDSDSGENMTGRAGFKAALKYCTNDHAEGLVVADMDRFSRSSFDSELISRIFKSKGKKLLSAAQSFDLEDKYGRFGFKVNQAVAELVREQIKERCYTNRMLKKENGGWIGCRPRYGYRAVQGELVEDKDEQFIIRYIRRLYHWAQISQVKIVNYLNQKLDEGDERFLPKMTKPAIKARRRPYQKEYSYRWNQSTVSKILNRNRTDALIRKRECAKLQASKF